MNYRTLFLRLGGLIFLLANLATATAATRNLEILGWVEKVRLPDVGLVVSVKLDSGAETSSLDAQIVKKFRQHGKRWVRFVLTDRASGTQHMLVRERIRTISVVQHDGSKQSRPVVKINICIADRTLATEVSLIDRSEFIYPMLLGRSALESFALIDPGNTFLSEPSCAASKSND